MNISTRSFVASVLGAFAIGALVFTVGKRSPDNPLTPGISTPLPSTEQAPAQQAATPHNEPLVISTAPGGTDAVNADTNSTPTAEAARHAEIEALHRQYMFATTAKEKIAVLDALVLIEDGAADALVIIQLASADADPTVRRQALSVLAGNGIFWEASLLPILEAGLADASLEVRQAALQLFETIGPGRYPNLVLKGLSSEDPQMRGRTMAMINLATTTVPINVYAAALTSTNPQTRLAVVDILRQQQAKRGVPLLIQALNDPDTTVRVEAQHNLFFLLDENFNTAEEAAAYWKTNSQRFAEAIFDPLPTEAAQ